MKHAYLIMAHNQFDLLCNLLSALDSQNNDIYLHIDKKAKDIDLEKIQNSVRYSKLVFIKSRDVKWGGYSQIQLELDLLKESTKEKHDYYHLLSGVDLPIKSNSFIDDFFEKNIGKEFVQYDKIDDQNEIKSRVDQFHLLQEIAGRKKGLAHFLDASMIHLQKVFGVHRMKHNNIHYRKGANWFSITHDLAVYVVSREKLIYKLFKKSICADELFLQTLVFNSDFKDKLYFSQNEQRCFNLRLIDWTRGNPYVYRKEDLDFLLSNKECLFARKFDQNLSGELIEKLLVINHEVN